MATHGRCAGADGNCMLRFICLFIFLEKFVVDRGGLRDSDGNSAGLEPSACRSTNTRKVFGQINSGGEGCAGRVPADATASYPPPPRPRASVREVAAGSRGARGYGQSWRVVEGPGGRGW